MATETIKGSFERLEREYKNNLTKGKLSIIKIIKNYLKYKKEFKQIKLKQEKPIEILLIGELYSLMDLESSNNLEKKLLKEGIRIYRYTNLTYLLIIKKFMRKILLLKGKKYIKYPLGADGTESVIHALEHSKKE